MKKALLIFLLIIAAAAIVLLLRAPDMAASRLQTVFAAAGFKQVRFGQVIVGPDHIRINDVKLDDSGYDSVHQVTAFIRWPQFLLSGKIDRLQLDNLALSRDSDSLRGGARTFAGNLLHLPDYDILLNKATIDVSTMIGDLRFTIDGEIEAARPGENRDIKARVLAEQYQLSFDSRWEGRLNRDGSAELSGSVADGRLNVGPLRVSRFNGWIGASAAQKNYTLQGEMNAGSATCFGVPLENISVVQNLSADQQDVIIRSGVSGMPDVQFTADYLASNGTPSFQAHVTGDNLASLLDYVSEATKSNKQMDNQLLALRDFALSLNYEPDKGFVGGPLPFIVSLDAAAPKTVYGNLLLYPDSYDVRGSVETTPELAVSLQNYFKIPSENIKFNYIRLDGNVRKLLQMKPEKPSTPPATAAPGTP